MIKLIIADDHKLVRDGLKALLENSEEDLQIVGEAANGKELIRMLPKSEVEVLLMDMNMPEMGGLEATQYIKEHFPRIKVLVLSMLEQEKYVTEALKAGALGYILKTTGQQELIHAIKALVRGEQYISTQIAMKLLNNMHSSQPITVSHISTATQASDNELTNRELEVLHYIAEGYTNAEIADLLFTSKRTVESHRQNLLQKTGCKNTASLIVYASRHHLIR
jgi:DNA-binding NarL/FixJ family response regulator